MPRILFIHSAGDQGPGEGSSRFLARLRDAMGTDTEIVAPLMPKPDSPEADTWVDATRTHLAEMSGPFVLLGHSLGGSIILKCLAQSGVPGGVSGVVTVAAPFWGAQGWEYDAFALPANAGKALQALPVTMLFGDADETVSTDHLELYRQAIPTAAGRMIAGDHEFASGDIDAVADAIRTAAKGDTAHG